MILANTVRCYGPKLKPAPSAKSAHDPLLLRLFAKHPTKAKVIRTTPEGKVEHEKGGTDRRSRRKQVVDDRLKNQSGESYSSEVRGHKGGEQSVQEGVGRRDSEDYSVSKRPRRTWVILESHSGCKASSTSEAVAHRTILRAIQ